MKNVKIAIIGTGMVGALSAFTLMIKNIASDIILVDIDAKKCKGEFDDLSDALPFTQVKNLTIGTLQDAGRADIAILCAGKAQKPSQTRLDLLDENQKIIRDILAAMKPLNPGLIIIVVTNPVDILTFLVQKYSGLPYNQVFGSGTFLDTQRLRREIAISFHLSVEKIDLMVIGEHGDNQIPVLSSATYNGQPLLLALKAPETMLDMLAQKTKNKAYDIISCKGFTSFGIASCIAQYCSAIVNNSKRIFPVVTLLPEANICLSLPCALGRTGILHTVPLKLSSNEDDKLKQSIEMVQAILKKQTR